MAGRVNVVGERIVPVYNYMYARRVILSSKAQLLTAVCLTMLVAGIGIHEAGRTDTTPEIVAWAHARQGSARIGVLADQRTEPGSSRGETRERMDFSLSAVLDRAIGGLEDLLRDPDEMEQEMLREQYSDWEFQSGQDSLLSRQSIRELLQDILGDDSGGDD